MNKILIIFSIFFLLSLFQCKNDEKNNTKENVEGKKNKEENEIEDKKGNIQNITAGDNNTTEEGFYMSEEKFDEKLKQILKERKLKSKSKISKDLLRVIFNEIYKKDFEVPDLPPEEASKMNPDEESKKFMGQIFDKVARGLDYDEKIRANQIKDWISPKRAQNAMNEVMQNLEEMMGYL